MTLILVIAAYALSWWLRSEKAAIDEAAAYRRGFEVGVEHGIREASERFRFRSLEQQAVDDLLGSL